MSSLDKRIPADPSSTNPRPVLGDQAGTQSSSSMLGTFVYNTDAFPDRLVQISNGLRGTTAAATQAATNSNGNSNNNPAAGLSMD